MPSFVAIDVETANPNMASICQIGIATFRGGEKVDEWLSLVDPADYFDPVNTRIHGITESAVRGAPSFQSLMAEVRGRLDGAVVVSHTGFDRTALSRAFAISGGVVGDCVWLDSAQVARRAWPAVSRKGYGLANVAHMLGITFRHHNALADAATAGIILVRAIEESGKPLEWWLRRVKRRLPQADGSYIASVAQEGNEDGHLAGEVVVFTGQLSMSRQEAASRAAKAGCDVATGVTKKTTILVVGDQDIAKLGGKDKSAKHIKAETLIGQGAELRILGESDFLALLESAMDD
ncbi:transposase [Bordetella trematum]|uniref:DNA polymerase III polC-type n=1 Tax=Bordetella trematum TaxID=123899 RepID=A0A157KXQ7_9BORD|nr:exonuclease domain-containing protein [Bordetella trematum]AZR95122.1 transposase [Bordetella trematum]NNH18670.1 transposase [Bordetella trematum]SAH88789.1 DNA polymerase III polC-type [Bordetella trematum]SAI66557.1 DNA polymerase III polC-type [Bordetella trematum]SUV96550.1 DNA polymerase III polC-type [Bordetella trematum]